MLQLLGSGGFATVYLARDDRLDSNVAVKVLAENWSHDADFTRRFIEEARLLRRCDDDRVVRVHTIEQLEDGRPYFVMDYADRGTLADRVFASLDEGRPFGVQEALSLSRELADCLTVVHDCGIVHRDLKPSNVLFRTVRPGTGWGGSGERMMLGDFGLARNLVLASGRTISAGTPAYVSPEQADPTKAASVDQRADVYSAAVILYELLVGEPPFDHANLDQAAARATSPDVRQARAGVPAGVAELIRSGLAADPDRRPPTAAAWMAAIDTLRAGLPPDPAAPSRPPRSPSHESAPAPSPAGFDIGPLPSAMVPAASGVGLAPPSAAPPPGTVPLPMDRAAGAPVPGGFGSSEPAGWTPPPVPPSPTPIWPPARPADPSRPGSVGPIGPTAGGPGVRRKSPWALIAGIVAALLIVVVVAVAVGRSNKAGPTVVVAPTTTAPATGSPVTTAHPAAGAHPPVTARPPVAATLAPTPSSSASSPATTAAAPPVTVAEAVSDLGRWFAAVTPQTCQAVAPALLPRGVDEAATCSYNGILADFSRLSAPRDGPAYLAVLAREHAGSTFSTWSAGGVGGEELIYKSDRGPTLVWTYTSQPYLGSAVGLSRDAVAAWWASSGRSLAPSAA